MKNFLLMLILLSNITYAQEEKLNKELMKASKAYNLASFIPQYMVKMDPVVSKYGWVDTAYFYSGDKYYGRLDAIIIADKSGDNSWITQIAFKINANLTFGFAYDPHIKQNGEFSDKVECALMSMQNGEITEVDYGYIKKEKIPSNDNAYLEIIRLNDGCNVVIQDKFKIKTIIFKDKTQVDLSDYTFK